MEQQELNEFQHYLDNLKDRLDENLMDTLDVCWAKSGLSLEENVIYFLQQAETLVDSDLYNEIMKLKPKNYRNKQISFVQWFIACNYFKNGSENVVTTLFNYPEFFNIEAETIIESVYDYVNQALETIVMERKLLENKCPYNTDTIIEAFSKCMG